MAAFADRPSHRCRPGGLCRHTPSPAGGKCAFPSGRRADGLCGRDAVAVYVNPRATPRNTYRCASHDSAVIVEAAAELGFRRLPVGDA